ncbi:regulator component [Kitasatospora sp. NPDC056184]|uniref:regulator component n=1 Tax=Kitasatospora sp. NPDC056184 TaxID=3345738 RepID=UPI0035DC4884
MKIINKNDLHAYVYDHPRHDRGAGRRHECRSASRSFQEGIVYAACEDRLNDLLPLLPHRFTEYELVEAVSTLIGRPIIVEPRDMKGNFACGLRERYSDREVISYEITASPLHRIQIIAHELGHILCRHPGSIRLADIPSDEELADSTDWSILGISARTSYETEDEQEAELMASLIIQRMYRATVMPAQRPTAADERWGAMFT